MLEQNQVSKRLFLKENRCFERALRPSRVCRADGGAESGAASLGGTSTGGAESGDFQGKAWHFPLEITSFACFVWSFPRFYMIK